MKLILSKENLVLDHGSVCEYGIWDEPNIYKWKMEEYAYVISPNYDHVVEVEALPEGFAPYKYFYNDGEFVRNPDWVEPPKPTEERVSDLEDEVYELTEYQAELLYELSLMQLGIEE